MSGDMKLFLTKINLDMPERTRKLYELLKEGTEQDAFEAFGY